MVVFYIFMALVLAYPAQGGIIQGFDSEDNLALAEKLEHFFERRCKKNADPALLLVDAQKLNVKRTCMEVHETFLNMNDGEEEIKRKCFAWRDEVEKCFDKFLELIEPCLEPEESYVPEFARKGYKAYFKFLCEHSNMLTVTELLETNMAKCINRFMKHKETNPQNRCYASTKISDKTLNSAITKQQLCHDLEEVYTCYEHKFKNHCSDAPKAWEFEKGVLNAMRSPCKN